MPKIFISYRRSDSEDIAGHIYGRLTDKFGRESIFFDVDTIPLGVDFRDYIKIEVQQCQVLIAIIGPDWLNALDEHGNRRVDKSNDWVRIEIESALERGIPVIPLLVRRAQLPRPHELPDSLEKLAHRNYATVRPHPDFPHDMNLLIEGIERLVREFENENRYFVSLQKNLEEVRLYKLRPYQVDLINDLYRKLNEGHKRVAIVAPYGAGKKVMGGQICAHAEKAGKRILILAHQDVIISQIAEKMESFGLHCGFIKAGWEENRDAPIQIASIQTMAKRRWWQQWVPDVVFYYEGHTTLFSQVGKKVLKTFPNAVHLVMTDTPERLGKEQMGDYMDTLVASPVPSDLEKRGFLAPMKYYSMLPDGVANLKEVKTVRGDYDKAGLKNACDRPELIEKIVREWQRLCPGKRTIAFCVDIEHARHVAAAFHAAGIPSDTVEGGTPIKDRKRIYGELQEEKILVLTSCDVMSIGFDEPSVEVGLMLRPTQARTLHLQQIGRVMQISPQTAKQYGIILDQAGNLERLGFPEDIKDYHLPVQEQKNGEGGTPPPTKPCPQCGRIVLAFIAKCPDCGHQWITERPLNLENMVEIYSANQAHQINDIPTLVELFHSHRRHAYLRRNAPTWAERSFWEHCGHWPKDAWYFGSIFGPRPTPEQVVEYFEYLQRSAKRIGKRQDWIVQEFEKEFGPDSFQQIGKLR